MMDYSDLEKAFSTIHNPRNWFLDKASFVGKSDLSGPAIDHTLLAQYGHVLSASSTDVPPMTTYLVQSPTIDLLRKVSRIKIHVMLIKKILYLPFKTFCHQNMT